MVTLPLAVAIADTVLKAGEEHAPVEVDAEATKLLDEHPEAEVTHDEVLDTLATESLLVGLPVQFG